MLVLSPASQVIHDGLDLGHAFWHVNAKQVHAQVVFRMGIKAAAAAKVADDVVLVHKDQVQGQKVQDGRELLIAEAAFRELNKGVRQGRPGFFLRLLDFHQLW